jgi:hypothetical protein
MTLPTYPVYILFDPAYGQPPYTQPQVEAWLTEISCVFPQITTCLPPECHLLASKYALRYLEQSEICDSPAPIMEVESRNDRVKYALAGNGNILANSTWGAKLVRLFKQYGCHHLAGNKEYTPPNCGGCNC